VTGSPGAWQGSAVTGGPLVRAVGLGKVFNAFNRLSVTSRKPLPANGSGKSTFLRLLAEEQVPYEGQWRLGARVVPGFFAQTHARPDLAGRAPVEILMTEHALLINEAMSALARSFERFLIFTPDGDVREATEPAWD